MKLIRNADTSHEDAREWYACYGWHLTTEREGDVTLDAVEYDWLTQKDYIVAGYLLAEREGLTEDEVESIIAKAREVRDAAEAVEGLLEDAVEAYEAGNLDGVLKALDEAERVESEHGASPATDALRRELVREEDETDLVCGNQVQQDHSGVGHCWRDVSTEDIPAEVRQEMEGEMIDGGKETCDDFVGSNGIHYRW